MTIKTKKERPSKLAGHTYELQTGCGPIFVTINNDDDGPFEVFLRLGKAGGCSACTSEAIGRMASLAFRLGGAPRHVIKQLTGISCHQPAGLGADKVLSCADAVATAINLHTETEK